MGTQLATETDATAAETAGRRVPTYVGQSRRTAGPGPREARGARPLWVAPAGTLPCPPRPGLGGGTYLRRLSRPCLLELLLRSAELLMMLVGARLPGDLA